jgi:hypothetical protein
MAYKRVSEEEFRKWAAQNPGATARINGRETTAPTPQGSKQGFWGSLATGVTKPIRTVLAMPEYLTAAFRASGRGQEGLETGQFQSIFLRPEEEFAWEQDPFKAAIKGAASLGAYGVPAGAAAGTVGTGARIGQAAGRGAIAGGMGGFGYSKEGEELKGLGSGAALGGILGGLFQGVGEGARAIKARGATPKIVDTMKVDEIAKLPKTVKSGLRKQAKSAGFWDAKVSESKNIQNYLSNRGLAGNTPADTLESLTQEFNRASKLKQEGLEEIGGLSRDYLKQVRGNLDEAISYKGILQDPEATRAYQDIIKTLEKGPQGAKDLDKIIMRWNEAGRLAKGAQKTSVAGLYADAARELRNVMKGISPTYNSSLQSLNQILGIEDVGTVAKTAERASRAGPSVPIIGRTPIPPITGGVSKAQSAIGRFQEGGGITGALSQGLGKFGEPISQVGQRAIPAIPAMSGALGSMPTEEVMPTAQTGIGGQPEATGGQIDEVALAQMVLGGQISTTEAKFLMELFGEEESKIDPKAQEAIKILDEVEKLTGTLGLPDSPVAAKLAGGARIVGATVGLDPQLEMYRDTIKGFSSKLARALGETGVLTDRDVTRALNLFPKATDSQPIATEKLNRLRGFLEQTFSQQETTTAPTEDATSESALYQMLRGR